MQELSDKVPVLFLNKYFSLSKSGYYKWKSTDRNNVKKEVTCNKIIKIFKYSKGTYGSPRVHASLSMAGRSISENTVAKYMKELSLDARFKKKFKVQTTDSNHNGPIANREFKIEDPLPLRPKEILAGDITYLKVGSKFYYLSIVMDLFNREIVGWSVSDSLSTASVLTALESALANCDDSTKIIFHSDRGVQYASKVFRELLSENNVLPSMSRKGNCYDNAYVETWFKSFKSEWFYRNIIEGERELRALIFEYIEVWYSKERLHSSLGYLSPLEYEVKHHTA